MTPNAPTSSRAERTAVLLNAHAKQVNSRVRETLAGLVPAENLFLSRDRDEAHRIADTVVARGFDTVFTGGGDGTFVNWVNHILDRSENRGIPAPRFGILALGTGNAVAETVGARSPVEDLRRYLSGEALPTRHIDLVTIEGRRTPFAGVGLDAAVLNDYHWIRHRFGTGLGRLANGLHGYALAIALRSAPRRMLQREPHYCEMVNVGGPAWQLDANGERNGRPIEAGELLYAGPVMVAAGGTIPYYGYRLRAFPFAGRHPGTMQFRVYTNVPVATLVANIGPIFAGEFRHPGILDFEVDRLEMRFDRPVPFHVGGDAEGTREKVVLGVAPHGVDVIDFSPRPDGRPAT